MTGVQTCALPIWRVVNAAEYGFPQRRIRVFIVAQRGKTLDKSVRPIDYITNEGVLARALPVVSTQLDCTEIKIELDKSGQIKNGGDVGGWNLYSNFRMMQGKL